MEIGLIFALLSAGSFTGANVFIRKGTFLAGESFTATLISVFVGVAFFLFLMLLTADWQTLWSLSWQGWLLLGAAGIMHFALGRLLSYTAFRLIGANKAGAIFRTQTFYAVIFGVLLLKEPLTIFLVLGVLCIFGGLTLVSLEKEGGASKIRTRGILAALGGAFFWGTSGILIKPVVTEIGSPYAAAFISYLAATLVLTSLLSGQGQRVQLSNLHRKTITSLTLGGVFNSIAQLFRYIALIYSPVSLVNPLIGTATFFTFFLSFLINRKIEVFTWKVFVGIVATVVGTFLLFQ